jgi:hypothetical protein
MRILCATGSDHGLTVSRSGGALPMDACPVLVVGACTGGLWTRRTGHGRSGETGVAGEPTLELEGLALPGQLERSIAAARRPAFGRLLA